MAYFSPRFGLSGDVDLNLSDAGRCPFSRLPKLSSTLAPNMPFEPSESDGTEDESLPKRRRLTIDLDRGCSSDEKVEANGEVTESIIADDDNFVIIDGKVIPMEKPTEADSKIRLPKVRNELYGLSEFESEQPSLLRNLLEQPPPPQNGDVYLHHSIDMCNVLEDDFDESENEAPTEEASLALASALNASNDSSATTDKASAPPVAVAPPQTSKRSSGVASNSPSELTAQANSAKESLLNSSTASAMLEQSIESAIETIKDSAGIDFNFEAGGETKRVHAHSVFVDCFLCQKVIPRLDLTLHRHRHHRCRACGGDFANVIYHKCALDPEVSATLDKEKSAQNYDFRYLKESKSKFVCCLICATWMPPSKLREHVFIRHFCAVCRGFFYSRNRHGHSSQMICQRGTQTDGYLHEKNSGDLQEKNSDCALDLSFDASDTKNSTIGHEDSAVNEGEEIETWGDERGRRIRNVGSQTSSGMFEITDEPPPRPLWPPLPHLIRLFPRPDGIIQKLTQIIVRPPRKPQKIRHTRVKGEITCTHCKMVSFTEKLSAAHLRLIHLCPLPACADLVFPTKKMKKDHIYSGHTKFGEKLPSVKDSSPSQESSPSNPVQTASADDKDRNSALVEDSSSSQDESSSRPVQTASADDKDGNSAGCGDLPAWSLRYEGSDTETADDMDSAESDHRNVIEPHSKVVGLIFQPPRPTAVIDPAVKKYDQKLSSCSDQTIKNPYPKNCIDQTTTVKDSYPDSCGSQPVTKKALNSDSAFAFRTSTNFFSCSNCSVAKKCSSCKERLEAFEQDYLRSVGVIPAGIEPTPQRRSTTKRAYTKKNKAPPKVYQKCFTILTNGSKPRSVKCIVEGCDYECRYVEN